jgi:TRAP transporter TAXI family solute receptor
LKAAIEGLLPVVSPQSHITASASERDMKLWSFVSCLALCAVGLALPVHAEKTTVRLATATEGGGFRLFGTNAAEVVNEIEPSLNVVPETTKGSGENIELLVRGATDIGLVQGVAAHEAFAGIGRAAVDLKIITAIYSSPGMFVVRSDSPARAVRDLTGKPVAWGTETSGLTLMARYIMDGLGLDRDNDFAPRILKKAGDGPALVLSGEVAAFWGGGIGWPGFTRVMEAGGRFIGFSAEEVRQVNARHGFLKPMTVPPDAYVGQKEAILTIGVWNFILARRDLPDDVAYRLAKALHRGHGPLATRLPQARETTPENTRAAADEHRIHPGVVKYLKELGL